MYTGFVVLEKIYLDFFSFKKESKSTCHYLPGPLCDTPSNLGRASLDNVVFLWTKPCWLLAAPADVLGLIAASSLGTIEPAKARSSKKKKKDSGRVHLALLQCIMAEEE